MTVSENGDVVRSARQTATKWANQCLSYSDVYGRWVDILAVAGRQDERTDVAEEGQKGLDPWTYYADRGKSLVLPDWKEMVEIFFKQPVPYTSSPEQLYGYGMDIDERSVFTNFPGDRFMAFPVAVDYCKRILFLTALPDFKVEPGWERQLGALVRTNTKSRETIRAYLRSEGTAKGLRDLLSAAFEGMRRENHIVVERCATSFVELACFAPRTTISHLGTRAAELMPLVKSNKKEIRVYAAGI
jgi:proteasome component ECM29